MNSVSGKTFATVNPTTGEKICDIQEGDKVSSCTMYDLCEHYQMGTCIYIEVRDRGFIQGASISQ